MFTRFKAVITLLLWSVWSGRVVIINYPKYTAPTNKCVSGIAVMFSPDKIAPSRISTFTRLDFGSSRVIARYSVNPNIRPSNTTIMAHAIARSTKI